MHILYLHGFSSAAASHKANALQQQLAPTPFTILDYASHQPVSAVATINTAIETIHQRHPGEQLALMGSSLGGYYAQYLAATRDDIDKVVLINPALDPQPPLKPWIGTNTNMVNGEQFVFSHENWEQLARYDVVGSEIQTPTLLLLDAGDTVIPVRYAIDKYRQLTGKTVVYPGGSHSFDHLAEALPEIRHFLGI